MPQNGYVSWGPPWQPPYPWWPPFPIPYAAPTSPSNTRTVMPQVPAPDPWPWPVPPFIPYPQSPAPQWSGNPDGSARTRSAVPLSPADFPGTPSQPNPAAPPIRMDSALTESERNALQIALGILKEYPSLREASQGDTRRVAIAVGYISGFIEAKGFMPPGSMLSNIKRGDGSRPDPQKQYNQVIDALESLLNSDGTREIDPESVRQVLHIVGYGLLLVAAFI